MSWQVEAFGNLIQMAKEGREDAFPPLRRMIERSAESAGPGEVIRLAELILEFGKEQNAAKESSG